jgi:hypothetical protein
MLNWIIKSMSKPNLTTQRIVYFRMARPLLDFAMLVIALVALIGFRNMEMEHQLNHKPNLRIQQQVPVQKALFTEEKLNSEADLWQAWGTWINTHQPSSGQCILETRATQNESPFYFLCFGKEGTGKRRADPIPKALADKNIFVQAKVQRTVKQEKQPGKISPPVYKVQGWVNTEQGQKTFDPIQKKWLP